MYDQVADALTEIYKALRNDCKITLRVTFYAAPRFLVLRTWLTLL